MYFKIHHQEHDMKLGSNSGCKSVNTPLSLHEGVLAHCISVHEAAKLFSQLASSTLQPGKGTIAS